MYSYSLRFGSAVFALLLSSVCTAAYAAPILGMDKVAGDNVINFVEDDANVAITGTTSGVELGQAVTVTTYDPLDSGIWSVPDVYNGTGSLTQAFKSGSFLYQPTWTSTTEQFTSCAPIGVINLTGADYSAQVWVPSAYVTDGNMGIQPYVLDSYGKYASILWQSVGTVVGDSWHTMSLATIASRELNYKEAGFDITSVACVGFQLDANGKAVGVTGDIRFDNVSIVNPTAGSPVSFTFSAINTYSGSVAGDGTWAVTLPAADAQALKAKTTFTADVANLASQQAPQAKKAVYHPMGIGVNVIAGDNAVNLVEDDADVIITGASGGLEAGQSITATTYDSLSAGLWEDVVTYSGSGVATQAVKSGTFVYKPLWNDSQDKFTVYSPIAQINMTGATYSVDVWVPAAYVTDGKLAVQPFVLDSTGKYAAIVWKLTSALVGNSWNTLTLSAISTANLDFVEVGFDLTSVAAVGLQLNSNGKAVGVTGDFLFDNLSITSVAAGTPIGFTFTSKSSYMGTVAVDGTWSVTMPAADAQALPAASLVTADGANLAGQSAWQGQTALRHTLVAPTIAIGIIAGDDHIDATEDNSAISFTGTTTGVEDGQTVTLTLNGSTYTGSVAANAWSISIPSAALEALHGTKTVTADVANVAGDIAVRATKSITAVNDKPIVTLPSAPAVVEDDIGVAIANDVNIADVEGHNQSVTLTITGGTVTIGTAGLTFSTGDGTNDASLVFSGTLSAINTALDAMTFTPTANLNGTNASGIQIATNDGFGGSDSKTLQFNISPVNDAPIVSLPSAPVVAEDDFNVAIADNIHVTDVDGHNQAVTLSITGGTVSIGTAGLTFSTGDGTSDASLVFTGTLSAINTALDAMTFTPTANLNGSNAGGIQIGTNDGNGGTDSKSLLFNITSVNDAPVVTLPSPPTVSEDASNVAIADNVNIADVEGDSQTVTLAITGGTVSIGTTGLTFSTGDGANDASLAFTGTLSAINAALDAMTFTPTANLSGSNAGGIQIGTNDGNGGGDSKTLQFNIAAVNDAPVVTLPTAPTVSEDATNVAIADNVNIADVDGDNQSVTLAITGGTVSIGTTGLTFSTGDGTNDASLAFTGTLSAINAALDAMTFTPTANLSGSNAGGIQIGTNDGNGGTDSKTLQFNIAALNDAPVVTLPSPPTVSEDATNVAIADDVNIADVDGDSQSVTLTITGGTVSIGSAGLTFSTGDGANDASLVFTGTLSAINTALDAMTFTPTANLSGANAGGIQIGSNDSNGGSDSKSLVFNIASVNDAPVVTLPSAPTVSEDATNVAIADDVNIADVDGDNQSVTLAITGGTVSIGTAGLTFSSGDGINDASLAFSGTLAAINTALDAMTFTPTANLSGSNAGGIQIGTNDGNGGTDSKSLVFNIAAVNDAPVVTLPSAPTVSEDATNVAIADDVNIADVDGDNQTGTLTITGGTVSMGTTGLTFSIGDGTNDASLAFTGTLSAINTALDAMTFTPTANLNGSNAGGIQIGTSDGNGGTDSKSLVFNIAAVNDLPVVTLPSAPTVSEDATNVAIADNVNIADVDGDNQSVTLAITGGTVSIGTTGLTFSTGDGTNDASLAFTGTLSAVNTALDAMTFTPTANLSGSNAGGIQIGTNDGNGGTDSKSLVFNIASVNDAPVVTLPSTPIVSEDATNVAIADDVNISDVDGHSQRVTIAITGGTISIGTIGLTFSTGDGTNDASLAFAGTLAAINTALDAMTFTPSANLNGSNAGGIQISSDDGNGSTDSKTLLFNISSVNDAPVVSLPSAPVVSEDDADVLIADDVHIADIDGDSQSVTLTVTGGTVSISTTGLTFSTGDGTNDASLTFTGTLSATNTALDAMTFTPTANLNGNNAGGIRIDTNDTQGGTDSKTLLFNVAPVNDAPVISGSPATSVAEDSTYNFVPAASDVDAGDSLTFSILNRPSWLIFSSSTGQLSGTPTGSDVGVFSNIVISVSDGTALASLPSFSITVVNSNDAPVVTLPTTPTVVQNATGVAIADDVQIVDADADNQTVTLTATGGTLSVTTTGLTFSTGDGTDDAQMVFTGTLVNINSALDSMTFTATPNLSGSGVGGLQIDSNDAHGGSHSQSLRFDITAAGTPSISLPLPPAVFEDDVLVEIDNALHINDSDNDDQTVGLSVTGGTVSLNGLGLIFSMGDGIDDQLVTFTGTLAAVNAALDSLAFSAQQNLNGVDAAAIKITASDNDGSTSVALIFDITAVNDAPLVALPAAPTVMEDAVAVAIDDSIAINDVDGDSQTVSLTATGGTLTLSSIGLYFQTGDGNHDSTMSFAGSLAAVNAALDSLTFRPTANLSGSNVGAIEIQTIDGNSARDTKALTFDILAVNDAPVIALPSQPNVTEDDQNVLLGGGLAIADVDANAQSVTLTSTGGTLSIDSTGVTLTSGTGTRDTRMVFSGTLSAINTALGTLTFTPTANLNGTAAGGLQVQTADGQGGTDDQALSFDIVAVNDAPTIGGTPATAVNEDTAYRFVPAAADAENDSLLFTVANAPTWASFNTATGELSGIPANADVGTSSNIVVSVSDGVASVSLAPFNISVINVNDAPSITGSPASTVAEDSPYSFTPAASDMDGDSLTFSVAGLPGWAIFDSGTGSLTGIPGNADVGTVGGIVISVSDGAETASLAVFAITVSNTNDAPAISGVPSTSAEADTVYRFSPSASDPDGDALVFSALNAPAWASFSTTTGELVGTPASTDAGTFSNITISVSDGAVSTSLASFNLTVNALANTVPVASEQSIEVVENLAQSIVLAGSDADGDPLTYSVASLPGSGSLSGNAPTLNYTPAADFVGTTSFSFTVNDGKDTSPAGTVHITVLADLDGDGTPDVRDDDDDGDTIPDAVEGTADTDGDGIIDSRDTDSDNDGRPDSEEGTADSDGDGISDHLDSSFDEDGDGIPDIIEGTADNDMDGTPNSLDHDSDNDGLFDGTEALASLADSDSDGIVNAFDVDFTGGTDANRDGIDDNARPIDTDSDGLADYLDRNSDNDGLPDIMEGEADFDLDGQANYRDLDSDNDGMPDFAESGLIGLDADNDGTDDAIDVNATGGVDANRDGVDDRAVLDTDRDGHADALDRDSDNDGIPDALEFGLAGLDRDSDGIDDAFDITYALGTDRNLDGVVDLPNFRDTDGDGVPDFRDVDSDNDGIADGVESRISGLDRDADGVDDSFDADATGGVDANRDGVDDRATLHDADGDSVPNAFDLDSDNDGLLDTLEAGVKDENQDGLADPGQALMVALRDTDSDGEADLFDLDSDNDGVPDIYKTAAALLDTNNDGRVDSISDMDGDGLDDQIDSDIASRGTLLDNDHDAIVDGLDIDDDGDGLADRLEGAADTDGDGLPNRLDRDSDGDGVSDRFESGFGKPSGKDVDSDGLDDAFDADQNGGTDADQDGIDDRFDPDSTGGADLNDDGVDDNLVGPASHIDSDGDGILDRYDTDSDNDGLSDQSENLLLPVLGQDLDRDGIDDGFDTDFTRGDDANADGIDDAALDTADLDADGLLAYRDLDSDGDAYGDQQEEGDYNNDGVNDRSQPQAQMRTANRRGGSLGIWSLLMLAAVLALQRVRPRRITRGAVVVICALCVPVSVLKADPLQKLYLGMGAGVSQLQPAENGSGWEVVQKQDATYRLFLGYQFSRRLFTELDYTDLGGASVAPRNSALGDAQGITYQVPSISAGCYLLNPDQRFNVYLRLGVASIRNDNTGQTDIFDQSTSNQWLTGVGARWSWTKTWALRAEATSFASDAQNLSLSLAYSLGGKAKARAGAASPGLAGAVTQTTEAETAVLFDSGSDEVNPEYEARLEGFAEFLQVHPAAGVMLEGHADDQGGREENYALSQRRALAVGAVLRDYFMVDAHRITAIGHGATQPLPGSAGGKAREQNRRVTVKVLY